MKSRVSLLAAVLILTAALFLPGTGALPLTDRDEPRFARATVEMMERGGWVIPYFNEAYRFDKPPLVYWWMRCHYWLLGQGGMAARLHSITAAAGVAVLLALMGRRFFSGNAGGVAALTWLTSFQVLVHGRLCVADMPMVLAVTASQWALLELLTGDPDQRPWRGWFWILWGSAGFGFLAKGPIAWLVPGLTLGLWRLLFWKKPLPWKHLQAQWGWLVALLPVAAWGIPALIMTKGEFWNTGMGEHVVKRGTAALNGRISVPFYYVPAALLSLMPWIAWLPRCVARLREAWDARLAFLAAWFLAPQIIFFFYATQLPHYPMPGFPAFFLILGAVLTTSPTGSPGRAGWIYLGVIALAGLLILGGSFWLEVPGMPGLSRLGLLLGGLILCLSLTGMGVAWSGHGRTGRTVLGFSVLGLAIVIGLLGPQLRSLHPLISVQPLLQAASPDPARAVGMKPPEAIAWGYTEPSLVYYGGRLWKFQSRAAEVETRLKQRRPAVAVTLYQEWTLTSWLKSGLPAGGVPPSRNGEAEHARFLRAAGDAYELHWTTGLNPARSSMVKLAVWIRREPGTAPSAARKADR
jgi:4-amino-4-deoxy-L-arabinose transferase-like glycosyltransferase